jgi:hypothetical protein
MTRQNEPLSRGWWKVVLVVVLLPIVLPLVLITYVLGFAHRISLYMLIWLLWLPKGKDTLVVYSDSPIWRDYMETQVVPLYGSVPLF